MKIPMIMKSQKVKTKKTNLTLSDFTKLIFYFSFLIILSCSRDSKIENKNSIKKNLKQVLDENEDFAEFKKVFFTNYKFQLERIMFPLRGMDSEFVFDEKFSNDTTATKYSIIKNKFYWNKKGWTFLKLDIKKLNGFTIKEEKNKGLVSIKIESNTENFVIFFEFKLLKNKWFLTYYSSEWN